MADEPPLLFTRRLGGLYPANQPAEDALNSITGRVRVEIKQTRGNSKRNALYWSILNLCAPLLSERIEGDPLTVKMLHKILKDRAGLVRVVTLPSGDVFKDYDSTSFAKMTEDERAKYFEWAWATLSKWLEIDVTTLKQEAA